MPSLRFAWTAALIVAPASLPAQNTTDVGPSGRATFSVGSTTDRIRVDAVLNEGAWRAATPIPLAFETLPGDNTPARVGTDCRILIDVTHLYFGCRADEPDAGAIRAYVTDRDAIDGQDRVSLILDPFNDGRRAFNFTATALGVQLDGVFDQNGTFDASWDAIWESAGRVTETGFTVEAAIPFKSIRFPADPGPQTWGAYFQRWWPRSDRVQMLSMPWDRSNPCLLCQANLLTGLHGMSAGLNAELTPTVTAQRTDTRTDFPTGPIDTGPVDADVGLDVRWGVTPNLSLNAAFNPDFSQVEADAPQLAVNERFALFFPEKRPFFLEGADFFTTPLRAIFTRTIADPTVGSKLTGKIGGNAVGVIMARDAVTNVVVPSSQGSQTLAVDEGTTVAVGRFRRDVGASSAIGLLYTGREGDRYHNRMAGGDFLLRPVPRVTIDGQFLRSDTRYSDEMAAIAGETTEAFSGNAYRVRANYATRNWSITSFYQAFEPGFRADAGFITQVDMRNFDLRGTKTWWGGPRGWFTQIRLSTGGLRREEFDGDLIDEAVFISARWEGPGQSYVNINPDRFRRGFRGEIYTVNRLNLSLGVRPTGRVGFDVFGQFGEAVDFVNGREAVQTRVQPTVDLRVGAHLAVEYRHTFERLSDRGAEIFTAHVGQLRTLYHFSPRVFVRALVQVRDTDRNPALHLATVNPEETSLASQFLFSYKLNPQTVLFAGYSDARAGNTDVALERTPLTQATRTFFIKAGYALRP